MSIELGCVGLGQLFWMHGCDHRFTVVFIQTGPTYGWQCDLGAGADGRMGLNLSLQGAC